MTNTAYKGKHAKPQAYAGSTPRGPQRWARAADNALRNPNSKAGQIFFDRTSRAHQLRNEYPNTTGPFVHLEYEYGFNNGRFGRSDELTPKYYTCSLFCAAVVAQLDHGLSSYDKVIDFFGNDERVTWGKPTRKSSCQFCGTKVTP